MAAETRGRHLARSTLIVMVAFAAAKAISLVQTLIIARAFGISAEYDAFVAANRLPEVIFNLIAGGAVAFAFIPVFSGLLAKQETGSAWKVASHVLNTIFAFTAAASIFAFVFAPWLIRSVVASGFNPATQALTVDLMRILLISTLIFSVSGLSMGILQSFNRFLLPALAPILFDVGILIGVLVLLPTMGIYGLAWGAVLGAAMHLAIQIPGLARVGVRWSPALGWNDPNFRTVARLFVPRVADLALVSVTTIILTNLLSRLGEGATSAYDWGWRLMQIPETLIGTAMGIVIFPTLAALSSLGDLSGKRSAMAGSLRFILVLTIPSAAALIAAGRPLLALLEGGAFDASASALVYSTLVFFSLGIIFHSLLEVLARSFFADKDTLTPLIISVCGTAANIAIAVLFTGLLTGSATAESVAMLALANTVGVAIEVAILGIILHRRWGGIEERLLAQTALRAVVASFIMAVAIWVVQAVLDALGLSGGLVISVLRLFVIGLVGLLAYLGASRIVGLREVTDGVAQSVDWARSSFRRKEMPATP
jgi:putative peptidoglycan lipid II flippase